MWSLCYNLGCECWSWGFYASKVVIMPLMWDILLQVNVNAGGGVLWFVGRAGIMVCRWAIMPRRWDIMLQVVDPDMYPYTRLPELASTRSVHIGYLAWH